MRTTLTLDDDVAAMVERLVLGERAMRRGLFQKHATSTLLAEHRAGTANHEERLWALLNFELWHRIFIDGEAREDVTAALHGGSGAS